VVIPPNWKDYEDPTGTFRLSFPPEWRVLGQNVNKVVFEFDQPYGVAYVELTEGLGASVAKVGDQEALDALASIAMADENRSGMLVKSVTKGVWPFQPTGNFVLLNTETQNPKLLTQRLDVACPLDGKLAIVSRMKRVLSELKDGDKETLGKVIASVLPRGWDIGSSPIIVVRPTPTPLGTPQVSAETAVNFRAGPGTVFPVVGTAKPGQTYPILGRNTDGTWLQVCCVDGKPIWVAATVVKIAGDTKTVAVAQNIPTPPPSPTPAPTSTPKPVAPRAGLHARQRVGTWEIQPERVHKEKAVYWYGDSAIAMGNYAIVIVLAKNLASGTQDLARTLALGLRDDKGRIYEYSKPLTTERYANQAACWEFVVHPSPFYDINPGVETPLLMLWDVKEDVQSLVLVIADENDNIVEWDLGNFSNIPPYKK
jgi:uncharacterized protein YraI